jgi:hypothetical protein
MKWLTKNGENIKDVSYFKELDVLSVRLEAFLELESPSRRTKSNYIAIFDFKKLRNLFSTSINFQGFKNIGQEAWNGIQDLD